MTGRLLAVCLTLGLAIAAPQPALARAGFDGEDIRLLSAAMQAGAAQQWYEARSLATRISDPVGIKLVTWLDFVREDSRPTFEEVAAFVAANPDWPKLDVLKKRAETAIGPATSTNALFTWFERFEPVTTPGRLAWARALAERGQLARAQQVARRAWIDGSFSPDEQQRFLAEFGGALTGDDHDRRLDQLLWAGRADEAGRMLTRVDPGMRALAQARMQLRSGGANADAAVAKVPASLRGDPGLVYERVRWMRRKGRESEARELLIRYPLDSSRPDKWWEERDPLAREALATGRAAEAYRVARSHALTDPVLRADAEWLAGWIALRFLYDPNTALAHFQVTAATPHIGTRARGAYWAGRAAEATGQTAAAETWYGQAAQNSTTFHGQLAAWRQSPQQPLQMPADPRPDSREAAELDANELARAVRLLNAAGQSREAGPFVLQLAAVRDTPTWKASAAALAAAEGRPDLAIAIDRRMVRSGQQPLITHGYPLLPLPPGPSADLERPLVLAVIRQESAYRQDAVSRAGARGLMQLMPATARGVADKLNVPYAPELLTVDPAYNLKLGQSYLDDVIGSFGGSYVLGLAAYNAGPGRVRSWLAARGRPRDVEAAVDWIEMIPFEETRTYVQRVIEGMHVYRAKMSGGAAPLTLDRDLL